MSTVLSSYGQLCGCPEILKKSCNFFCRGLDIRVSLSMDAEKGRAGTRDIWNCFAGFWNVRLSMTGIRQVFRVGIITARLIRMPPLCT